MSTKFDISLLVKVAQMYYIEGLKQDEIAKQIGISRSLISMILTEARETGIVEIHIKDPFLNNDRLSRKFQQKFGLDGSIVIPTSVRDIDALRMIVAQRAVDTLNGLVRNGYVIGLGWGRTCHQIVSVYAKSADLNGISVVPLIGGSNQLAPYFQINEMVRTLAEKLGNTPYFIHAPSLVSDPAERELYCNGSTMQPIREKWRAMDIVITGIGSLPRNQAGTREIYKGEGEIYRELEKENPVGDICARYFNIRGEFVRNSYYDRIIGVPLEDLHAAKNVIAVVTGSDKAGAILGALRTNCITTLITDEQTASAVLNLEEHGGE